MSYIQSLFTGMSLALIVPCYNEENRLSVAEVEKLAGMEDVRVFLVNDGSTDNTLELIEGIAANNSAISVINYKQNQGKAATIFRAYHDINHENTLHTSYYGFLDADFSTTADAFLELYKFILNHNETEFIFASRIATLNSAIKRHVHRHYIGRIQNDLFVHRYALSCGRAHSSRQKQCAGRHFVGKRPARPCQTRRHAARGYAPGTAKNAATAQRIFFRQAGSF